MQGWEALELLTATNTQLNPISAEQLKAFIAKVQSDKSLQDHLNVEETDPIPWTTFVTAPVDLNSKLQELSDDDVDGLTGVDYEPFVQITLKANMG